MGTTPSSPLDLTLAYWKNVKDTAHNNSVDVKKGKWVIFCFSEWPSFKVNLSREGSFHLILFSKVEENFQLCTRHLDQIFYIVTLWVLID